MDELRSRASRPATQKVSSIKWRLAQRALDNGVGGQLAKPTPPSPPPASRMGVSSRMVQLTPEENGVEMLREAQARREQDRVGGG